MNSDILSKEKPTYLIVNPGLDDISKPPPPLHLKFEGTLDEIGPYSMAMQSQHCMVGGLLLFRLNLLFPPIDLFIYTIKVKIIQNFHLQSPVDKGHKADPPPNAFTVFIIDAAHPPNYGKVSETTKPARSEPQTPKIGPLKGLQKDEMWKIHHLARLPNDNSCRPTTFEGTHTPLNVSHTIQMELTYRPAMEDEMTPSNGDGSAGLPRKGKEKEPDRRKIVMSKPLEIFSVRLTSLQDTREPFRSRLGALPLLARSVAASLIPSRSPSTPSPTRIRCLSTRSCSCHASAA